MYASSVCMYICVILFWEIFKMCSLEISPLSTSTSFLFISLHVHRMFTVVWHSHRENKRIRLSSSFLPEIIIIENEVENLIVCYLWTFFHGSKIAYYRRKRKRLGPRASRHYSRRKITSSKSAIRATLMHYCTRISMDDFMYEKGLTQHQMSAT